MKAGNINFKGFSNVLCTYGIPASDGKRVSLITMRLNDEDGHKDLTELRKILEMQGYPLGNENEDILTLTYVDDKVNKRENMHFNKKIMYWGDELRQIEEKYIPKLMTEEKYQREKALHMKVYTLLASLTSRMSNAAFDGQDEGMPMVIKNMFKTLESILEDSKSAFYITQNACLKQFKFQQIAAAFNKGICRTMEHFFR